MQFISASEEHYLEVKNWFRSHQEVYTWGGPNMTYPMSDEDFINRLKAPHIDSFSLTNDSQELISFGQNYMRLGRRHLGRLAVNPSFRGQGLSKILITKLLEQTARVQPNTDASLFVFKDNFVAYSCYQSLGFVETEYPEDPFPDNMKNCAYMILPAANQT